MENPEDQLELCPECGDWTVLDEDGICEMCGCEYVHYEHDSFDMER